MKKILQREIEVAFSRHAQPAWFRLVKYPVFGAAGYLLWDTGYFWPCFAVLLLASLALHFFYRFKTKGWTRSFDGWDYQENPPRRDARYPRARVGTPYLDRITPPSKPANDRQRPFARPDSQFAPVD